MEGIEFYCDVCERRVFYDKPLSGGTGYATLPDDKKACYECCATIDRKAMDEMVARVDRGEKVKAFCLYITVKDSRRSVTNWPGTLMIKCHGVCMKRLHAFGHRIARLDVWFEDHNGRQWHGVNLGDNQIVRCKPLKRKRSK